MASRRDQLIKGFIAKRGGKKKRASDSWDPNGYVGSESAENREQRLRDNKAQRQLNADERARHRKSKTNRTGY